jgi:hypothetical protein
MKNTFTKNTRFDHFSKVAKSICIALFSLIASAGFAQSGTILVNGSGVPISSATKFPIWLSAGQTVNISTNVSNISGILYNITASSAGGNILTMNSVVNITGLTTVAANTTLKLEGVLFASTSGSAATAWNLGGNTAPSSSILGTTDGTSALTIQAGTGGLNIGTDLPAKTITIGTTNDVISENVGSSFTLNGIGTSIYSIGAATVTGTITVGGTAQTGAIGICTGTGVQTLNLGTGGTGAKTINIGTGAVANPITIGNTTAGSTISIPSIATFSNGTYSALFTGGSVGIGTATPYAPLTVAYQSSWTYPTPGSSAIGAINIHASTSPGETGITFSQAGANNAQAGIYVHQDNSAGTHMYFATTNSYATGPQVWMTILNNGNVGIGTITPTTTFQVNGTATITGRLTGSGIASYANASSQTSFTPPTSMSAASGSANEIPGLVVTITTHGGDLEISGTLYLDFSVVNARGEFSSSIDGNWVGSYLGWGSGWGLWYDGIFGLYGPTVGWDTRTYHRVVTNVPAGTHTIKLLAYNETANGYYINCCSMSSELLVKELLKQN